MPQNTAPIYPLTPYAVVLQGPSNIWTACVTRAPTATASLAAANIIEFVPTSSFGRRIDKIQVQGSSSGISAPTAAMSLLIFLWDGTTAFFFDEIVVTVQTPGTGAAAFQASKSYTNLVLPAAFKLYAACTVTTASATTAITVAAFGGDY